jgi:hypothetical protein
MLFRINLFWKLIFTLCFFWSLYFTIGFELCVVTILSLLLVFQNNSSE